MIYPTLKDALELHDLVLSSTGGAVGVRDQGLRFDLPQPGGNCQDSGLAA
jgi:hypothetical protein